MLYSGNKGISGFLRVTSGADNRIDFGTSRESLIQSSAISQSAGNPRSSLVNVGPAQNERGIKKKGDFRSTGFTGDSAGKKIFYRYKNMDPLLTSISPTSFGRSMTEYVRDLQV